MNQDIAFIAVQSIYPNSIVAHYLLCSYAYYWLDSNIVSDDYFDILAKKLYENYDNLNHPHKYLIIKKELEKKSSAYYLKEEDYPLMCRNAAISLLKNGAPDIISVETINKVNTNDPAIQSVTTTNGITESLF